MIIGKDLSSLMIKNISLDIGKNYFKGAGSLNLLKMDGEIKGNIYISPLNNLFSFYWKGDLNDGKGEIIPRDIRLKGKITFNSKGDISGNLMIPVLKGHLNLGVFAKNWKWKIYGKGENLEKYFNLIEFNIYNDFSFNGSLLLKLYNNIVNLGITGLYKEGRTIGDLKTGDLKGKFIYDFKNLIEIKDIYYSKFRLGDIVLNINSQGLDIKGDILEGRISGIVSLDKGLINLYEMNLKSIFEDLEGKVNGEIIIEDFLKFKIVSNKILYKNINFENINLTGKFQDGLYFDNFSMLLFDKFEVKGNAFIQEKNGKFEIKGNILENKFSGTYEKEVLNLYGDKFILKEFKILFNNWKIGFDNKKVRFYFTSPYLEYQGIPFKNLNINGEYKDLLGLNLKGEFYEVYLEINGTLKDEFNFDLYLDPLKEFKYLSHYGYIIKSKWRGNLKFKDEISLYLNLLKTEIPKIVSGEIIGKFNEKFWNLIGNFNFINKGTLILSLDSNRDGKIEGKFLPLEILKDLNIMNIAGYISLNLNLRDYSLENGDLYINLDFPFINKKIESNLKITKDGDYKINGDILKLSKNKGVIEGIFRSDNFNIKIFLPDSEFLYSLIPIEGIKYLEKGKTNINLSGNLKEMSSDGVIVFSNPVSIPYILNRIYSINFRLKYKEGKVFMESLGIEIDGSKVSGIGEIYPEMNFYLNLPKVTLNFPNLLQGYSDWEVYIKNIKDPLIEGKVLIYNSLISYPQNRVEGFDKLPKIRLSLDLNLGEKVSFYIPELINLSLKGEIKVLGDLSKPLLMGKIDFTKGNIQVLNRNFSIDYGYIKFPGLSFEENIWELSGFSVIQNYIVFLKSYGFMGQSSIYLTSVPPLSLKEILFLLIGQERLSLAKKETLPLYSLIEQ
ncbi:MAG: translocation/assembly module TamB, partial [Dictyoglomaceae bacterium]|nr:translocation/assembly module TamB [Dictyoglomaceae bacterium]